MSKDEAKSPENPDEPKSPPGMKFDVPPELAEAVHKYGDVVGFQKLRKAVEAKLFSAMVPEDVQTITKDLMEKAFDDLS